MTYASNDMQLRSLKLDGFLKLTEDKPAYFGDSGTKIYQDTDGSLTVEADVSVKIVNPENQADGTLGGTAKLVKVYIGATPYYFKVYPTVT